LAVERPGEVALVRETGGDGDAGERLIGSDELTSGEVHPQFADVVAQSTPAVPSENTSQVDRVDTGRCRDHIVREILSEPVLK
jgi:hypothetical protein